MRTTQTPIGSGFTAASTARDVIARINLSSKVAIVTGGSSGIGLETTRALWEAGGATALFIAGFGAAGYATRRDLAPLARVLRRRPRRPNNPRGWLAGRSEPVKRAPLTYPWPAESVTRPAAG